ncbi:hypothetical protein CLOHYLEM_05068 [[Clostridium] hylemonae DSM 15053]|uniref:Uncharacterized protein n=1 Tax=[Clostridium] hylemonae DSM 15053 TaxID=553973 RepID=C0BZ29_9FIRM|nr:hypothetical protein CLOHYLEM_05068 [[Clostridium] hylemonae DSM 15053]
MFLNLFFTIHFLNLLVNNFLENFSLYLIFIVLYGKFSFSLTGRKK